MKITRTALSVFMASAAILLVFTCTTDPPPSGEPMASNAKVLFLHHSTGGCIWNGGVPASIDALNTALGTSYQVSEFAFPDSPWPWSNYPADYYRLWINGEGSAVNQAISNLDTLVNQYDLIIWKHCYPVMEIGADSGSPDPASDSKTLENYKAAYNALKTRMHDFPSNRFIVWTGAVELANGYNEAEATRLREFRNWVIHTWDQAGDNIFVFDFWVLETGGENQLYLDPAKGEPGDSHPNGAFSATVAPLFAQRITDVLQGKGDTESLTGQ